jgi:hypothetical protein
VALVDTEVTVEQGATVTVLEILHMVLQVATDFTELVEVVWGLGILHLPLVTEGVLASWVTYRDLPEVSGVVVLGSLQVVRSVQMHYMEVEVVVMVLVVKVLDG